jgi:hypothetical protein
MTIDLIALVKARIDLIGPAAAAEAFGVGAPTIQAWQDGTEEPFAQILQMVLDDYVMIHPPQVWDIGKKVMLLMPIYRSVNGKTVVTLLRNYSLFGRDKVGFIPKFRTLIHEARNALAEMFLQTDSEWCIMIDDDTILPCGSGPMLRGLGLDLPDPMASHVAITRILSRDPSKLIVGALAFGRHTGHLRAACSDGNDSARANDFLLQCRTQYRDTLKEVRWTGLAFTRIHRSVFELLKEASKTSLTEILPSRPGRHYGFFTPLAQDRGEDAAFALRAASIGIKSYVDTGLIVGHSGEHIY